MKDLVSIVMPAYNSEKYISDSINSVIKQTYTDWELIIIDDCSKDNTLSIVKEFQATYNNIRIYRNDENSGVSKTRNKGIYEAQGEWIAFLDSDDMWEENKLAIQMKYAQKNNANFMFTGVSYIDENGSYYKGIFEVPEKVAYKKLLKQNIISCSSVLVKKSYFTDIKMENDNIHEDFCVWLKILRLEPFAYGINQPLLIYRISRNSKSGNKIKSLKMAYKTYRYLGINPVKACYFMLFYIAKNLKKYKNIYG